MPNPAKQALERNLIIQIAAPRRVPGRPTCAAAGRPPAKAAGFRTAGPGVQHRQLAVETAEDNLGRVALLALLVGPLAGLQGAFDVDLRALLQEPLRHVGDTIVEDYHPVPLRPFL